MGAIVVIVGIALMIIIHEGAHFVAAKVFNMKATEAFFGFGPTLLSTTRGETEYGVKAIPLGGYVRIIGMNPFEEIDASDEHRTYRAAPFWQKSIVVLAGIASHLVVALFLFFLVALIWGVPKTEIGEDGRERAVASTTVGTVAATVDGEPTPASQSGIEVGDQVVTFDGEPVETWQDFGEGAAANPGEAVTIGVIRDGEPIALTATLTTVERPVEVDGEPVLDENGDAVTEEKGYFGIAPTLEIEEIGFFAAIGSSVTTLWTAIIESVKGLGLMVVNFPRVVGAVFGAGGEEVLETARPISPIGLVRISDTLQSSLILLALVNVFVAVLNVVPLYPLDGGHFAVALYEKIRGRTPDVRKLMPVAVVVFAFVVALGLLGIYLDIFKPLQL